MTNRLVLLLGEFGNSEKAMDAVLREWSSAGLLDTVAWTSIEDGVERRPRTTVNEVDGAKPDYQ